MARIFRIMDEIKEHEELLERAFKEGCEHGYKMAHKEFEKKESHLESDFESIIAKIKEKYN